jgi:putative chitinase
MNITQLQKILPATVYAELPLVMNQFSINTQIRLSHFLAQCAHESGNWKFTVENLNYSASGLRATFSKYFPTDQLANAYARQPQRIASRVYANRMGNGAEDSQDGWKYRGRGYIQLTGKNNYSTFNNFVSDDIIQTPDFVATKYPLTSAGWFWHTRNINRVADRGSSPDIVRAVTVQVNGGTNGLTDRITKFGQYFKALS